MVVMGGIIFGCWDLFHEGHLNALKQCGDCVELLHVGVFSDRVILSYKGKMPIIPEQQRLRIVQHINLPGCRIHAYIVRKRKLCKELDCRYAFVSETLRGKELKMVNKDTFKGKIVYIHYTPRISTTAIRNRVLLTGAWKAVHD